MIWNYLSIPKLQLYLKDWWRSGGSYSNSTWVICCLVPGRPESAAQGKSPLDNKLLRCCWRNSQPTVINPNYNITKQLCMKHISDKICSKAAPNRAPSPTCLSFDITHTCLTTGIVALYIPSWRVRERERRRQARKTVWPIIYMESPITHKRF